MCAILLLLLAGVSTAYGSPAVLPDAPKPQLFETKGAYYTRFAVLSSVAAGRFADWYTTEQCMQRTNCKEAELPTALVKSKVGFGAYESATVAVEWVMSNRLAKRHPRLALMGDVLSSALVWNTVGHNIVQLQ